MEQNGTHPQEIDERERPSDQPPDFNRGFFQPSPEDDIVRAPASVEDDLDDLSDLTPRQLAALPYLVAAPTLAQGARLARIGRTTLYRWMSDDLFRSRFKELRSEAEELAQTELQGLLLKSTLVLAELMEDPSPHIRLRAAQAMMAAGLKAGDTRDFVRRLERLDDAVSMRSSRQPPR